MRKNDDGMGRRAAVEYAIASVKMEEFEFTEEEMDMWEEVTSGKISNADLYRILNDKLPPGARRAKIAITTCGHNPNITDLEKMVRIGDTITCEYCQSLTRVVEIVE